MTRKKRMASVDKNVCVSCGECQYVCPMGAVSIVGGMFAQVDLKKCVGCGKCFKSCPAGCIKIIEEEI